MFYQSLFSINYYTVGQAIGNFSSMVRHIFQKTFLF